MDNVQQPKKISLLGSVAGIFAAMLTAVGLFTIGQIHDHKELPKQPSIERIAPTTPVVVLAEPILEPKTVITNSGAPEPVNIITTTATHNPSPETPIVVPVTPIPSLDASVHVQLPLVGQVLDTVDNTVSDIIGLLE